MIRFFLVAGCVGIVIVLLSFLWPRISDNTRPALLQSVYEMVAKTSFGKTAENVLGVSDPSHSTPLTLDGIRDVLFNAAQERINTVIVTHAIRELRQRFERLPQDQQQTIEKVLRDIIEERSMYQSTTSATLQNE